MVTFDVDSDSALNQGTNATIRYRNLVGQRYIALTPGHRARQRASPAATHPARAHAPALDLTVLFNGFKPLFAALSPDDVNKLSYEIIQVFQGEGGTVESLLQSTASVTNALRRPRQGHRRADHEPQRRARDPGRPRRPAVRPDRPAAAVRLRAEGRPGGDLRLARRHLGPRRADGRPRRATPDPP